MACPHFCPVKPDPAHAPSHATLPLGDAWSGVCQAQPESPWQPGADTLYPLCNIGYARERCPRFPPGDGPDAVRFSIVGEEDRSLQLYYVVERDHLPLAHGRLEYRVPDGEIRPAPALPAVIRLAQAYVSSYFQRRGEAGTR